MVTGGIPHYMASLQKGGSIATYINQLCFTKGGVLTDEFEKLFASLYDKPAHHIAMVRALASKWKGLTRKELVIATGMQDGGQVTRILSELEASDFITITWPFGKKKKDALYRLTDPYTLFYLKFMENKRQKNADNFLAIQQSANWHAWCGYAFENVCLYHLPQIKAALGIAGVHTQVSGYLYAGSADYPGFQIDMVIDRADGIINLCEMKFYDGPFTVTKALHGEVMSLRTNFRVLSGTRKSVHLTMIASYGVAQNQWSGVFDNVLKEDILFGS
jgi:uncharacterized protein